MRNWVSGSICFVVVAICGVAFAQQSFYSIHISSHRQQAKADTEVKKLKTQGLDAFMRHEQVQGKGMWYRIYVGKYATKKEATGDINRLKQMKVSKYFAIRRLSGKESASGAAAAAAAATQAPATAKARPPAAKAVNYYLFVGFYRDLDPAQKELSRLTTALAPYGKSVFLTRETVTSGMIYRVYIGTYTDRQQAAASGAELKGKKLLTSFYIPIQTTQDMISGRMPDAVAGTAGAAAAATAAAAAATPSGETQKAAGKVQDKKPAPRKTSTAADLDDFSRFTVMLKGGVYLPQNVDKFAVSQSGVTYRISDDAAPQIGIEGSLRFNKNIGFYANADTVLISKTSWYNISAGPMLTFQAGESVMPFLKGGAIYSSFSWDAPGDFDSSVGWEVGTGLNFSKSNFKFGIEFDYRNTSFDYKPPSSPLTSATESSLDMSGFSLMVTFSYWF